MECTRMFPVICVVFSVSHIVFAQPPFQFHRSSPWGLANEIYGSGPPVRAHPGVLIAGHAPPVVRLPSQVPAGSRLAPLIPSPSPSSWPNHGAQIQRAKESSHFEYEVFPHPMNRPKPPTVLRPAGSRPRPVFSHGPEMPQDILRFLAEDSIQPPSRRQPALRLQSRTDRPQIVLPTSNPELQDEGYRILSDLFVEDAGGDIRQNLVGGSEISFNGAYYPIANLDAASLQRHQQQQLPVQHIAQQQQQQPLLQHQNTQRQQQTLPQQPPQIKQNKTENPDGDNSDVQILQAEEHPLLGQDSEQQVQIQPTPSPRPAKMQESESSLGISFRAGPTSHSSFMFTDPNEGPGGYMVHDGGYGGPPPPFHSTGNTLAQGPPQAPRGGNNDARAASQNDQQGTPESQQSPGGYSNQNNLRSGASGQNQMPVMMMPVGALQGNSKTPQPSSEEVQYALGILARYASKQAQQMGTSPQSQQMGIAIKSQVEQQEPRQQLQEQSSPSPQYGPPPQQQETPTSPSFLASSPVAAQEPATFRDQIQGPSVPFTTPDSTSATSGQTEETSPYPVYGPPTSFGAGDESGISGGYDQGGSASGGYSQGGSVSGGYSQGGSVSGGYSQGSSVSGGYGQGGSSGGGASGIIGAKVEALKTIQSAVTGGFRQITGLKAGILNAGLNAIGSLGKAKGDLANSLKIPLLPQKGSGYGPPSSPGSSYGPPETSTSSILDGVKDAVGSIAGTVAQTGRAAVGIGLSKNQFVKNHIAIKGQAFTETVSKTISNKNQYFQDVLKHIQSIFDAATERPVTGGKNPW